MASRVLPFTSSEEPVLSDFIIGKNDDLLCAVRALAQGKLSDTSLYIWGEASVGKSCLLRAANRYARELGVDTYHAVSTPRMMDTVPPPLDGLLVVDDVDSLPLSAQATLLDWHNHAACRQRQYLLAAGSVAAERLPVMDALKTRLAGGLVFRLRQLDDSEKQKALAACAARRGFDLPPAIGNLLLSRLPRNMHSLDAALAELDAFLLARQKPLTVRQVNDWLASRLLTLSFPNHQ